MEEQTANLTALMEKLLSRFDEEQALADKRAEAQAAFNSQVSHELQSLSKQIGRTQAEVDDVRKVASPAASSAPSTGSQVDDPSAARPHTPATQEGPHQPPPAAIHTSAPDPCAAPPPSALPIPQAITGNLPLARLTNEGPPLLARPEHTQWTERTSLPPPREEYSTKPPKHNFPRFEGDCPHVWLDRCLAYFELYRVPPHNWVATAALYVEGHAALWLRAYRQQHPVLSWDTFRRAIEEEFGPEEFESLMHSLLQLRQTGTVVEYRQQF